MRMILILSTALLCAGCASTLKYPPYPAAVNWQSSVKILGKVTADSGAWPLSLNAPPPEYTYYSALQNAAAKQFSVPLNQIVLGEVSVNYMAEIDGTIRSWTAIAIAGQETNGVTQSAPAAP